MKSTKSTCIIPKGPKKSIKEKRKQNIVCTSNSRETSLAYCWFIFGLNSDGDELSEPDCWRNLCWIDREGKQGSKQASSRTIILLAFQSCFPALLLIAFMLLHQQKPAILIIHHQLLARFELYFEEASERKVWRKSCSHTNTNKHRLGSGLAK